ncbi:MAG TPA: HAD family hydrolase [Anaerolineales bacterium]|nr:HAD family hydrolase [Anaerolineales bacterium]
MIRALVFDFDGLILETEGPIFHSWQKLFASYGFALPFEVWATIIGTTQTEFDPATELERLLGHPLDWAQLEPQRQAHERFLIDQQPLLPGVEQTLQDALRLGLKLGLASSSSCEWVDGHLRQRGLRAYFDVVRTADDVRLTKPDPELYLAVLSELGVPPTQALALEDSPNGIRAAKAAGMYCVAVPNPMTNQLPLHEADLRLASLAEMPLQMLLETLEKLPIKSND